MFWLLGVFSNNILRATTTTKKLAEPPALLSSALCWAFNVLLPFESQYSNNICCGVWSLRWKSHGSRILRAKVAVVLHHPSRESSPHIPTQQSLVWTLGASVTLAEGVGNDVGPNSFPNSSPRFTSPRHLHSPHPAKHWDVVLWMVSHRVQCFATLNPLLHCFHLA